MKIWRFYRNLLRRNKVWLTRASSWGAFWIIAGVIVFFFRPDFIDQVQSFLEQTFQDVLGTEELGTTFSSVILIFQNNLLASLIAMFAGIILSIVPFFSLGVNFFILGFLLAYFSHPPAGSEQAAGALAFLVGIIPHGIFEIPALIIATALGLRLGWFWWRPVRTEGKLKNLWISLKFAFQAIPLLIFLFFIAALVEVFVTGFLLEKFVG